MQVQEVVTEILDKIEWIERRQRRPPPKRPPEPVSRPPRIVKHLPAAVNVRKDEVLTLSVTAEAAPEASFTWYINSFEVRQSAFVRHECPAPNVSRLILQQPKEGEYKVIARNKAGTTFSTTYVTVEGEYLLIGCHAVLFLMTNWSFGMLIRVLSLFSASEACLMI